MKDFEKIPAECCYYVKSNPGFQFLEGNRDPINPHIREIARALKKHEHIPAIMVARYEGELYIVDGQHRYLAACSLWDEDEPYKLLVEEYDSVNPFMDAIKFNNTAMDWDMSTYLRAFAAWNYPNFREFLEWISSKEWNRDKLPYTLGLAMLGVRGRDKIKQGVLQLGSSFREGDRLYNEIKDSSCFNIVLTNEASVKAFYRLYNGSTIGLQRFIESFEDREHIYPPTTSKIKDWVEFFETI